MMAFAQLSAETAAAMVREALPETGAGQGCVGITSVIGSYFRGGTKFAAPIPPGPRQKKVDKASGLDVGDDQRVDLVVVDVRDLWWTTHAQMASPK